MPNSRLSEISSLANLALRETNRVQALQRMTEISDVRYASHSASPSNHSTEKDLAKLEEQFTREESLYNQSNH